MARRSRRVRGGNRDLVKLQSWYSESVARAIYKLKGDLNAALSSMKGIQEPWLQIHPQLVVEHDKLLRSKGITTLEDRERLLSRIDALEDEWVVERRVQLLIDKGEFKKAKDLLMSAAFQKVHQTYTRTNLWNQVCKKLNEPCLPIPQNLGEDRLATFGAYREFE